MAKSSRRQKSRKVVKVKTARKTSARPLVSPDGEVNLEPITVRIRVALKQLQALKPTPSTLAAQSLLERWLEDFESLATRPPAASTRGGTGALTGGSHYSPAAESRGWDMGDAGAAPSVSTHGSGGGGFD